MSSKSKTSQSGLRTLQRDFSASSMSSQPLESDWPPSPPPAPQTKQLTGAEKRLKDIQDAMAAHKLKMAANKPVEATAAPLVTSKSVNKRPSDAMSSSTNPAPTKKRRELPGTWEQPMASTSRPTRPNGMKEVYSLPPTTTSAPAKISKVFLSEEQKTILKLVEGGDSVFYTGSAGTSSVSGYMRVLMRRRYWKIRSLAGDYQVFEEEVRQVCRCCCYYCFDRYVVCHVYMRRALIQSDRYRGMQHRRRHHSFFCWRRFGYRRGRGPCSKGSQKQKGCFAMATNQSPHYR